MVVNEELKLFWKCIKNVRGDQGGCERRIEVIVKMQKREKKVGGGSGLGGQFGCERRIEVIVKILGGFGGGGVRSEGGVRSGGGQCESGEGGVRVQLVLGGVRGGGWSGGEGWLLVKLWVGGGVGYVNQE